VKNTNRNISHLPKGYYSPAALFGDYSDPIGSITQDIELNGGKTYEREVIPGKRVILTQDIDFIDYILTNPEKFLEKWELISRIKDHLGNGILFSKDRNWDKNRRVTLPNLSPEQYRAIQDISISSIEDSMNRFPTGEQVDVFQQLHKSVFESLFYSVFNETISERRREKLVEVFDYFQEYLLVNIDKPFTKAINFFTGRTAKVRKEAHLFRSFLESLVEQRKSTAEKKDDILNMLLQATYRDDGTIMTTDELVDEIILMFFIGYETLANTLSFSLYMLAKTPSEMEKLQAAIGEETPYSAPMNLPLVNAIKETIRLFPSTWNSEQVALEAGSFQGDMFPKGTRIVPFFYGVHRDPENWEQPRFFSPERFERLEDSRKTYFPFGVGPRVCVGQHLFLAKMTMFLHCFLERFNIAATNHHPKLRPLFTLRPDKVVLSIKRNDLCII